MLLEIEKKSYRSLFPSNQNPFISDAFIELNKGKVDKVVRIVEDVSNPGIGLIAGIRKGMLLSPFSAPFGGFHFRKEIMYSSEIDNFLKLLKEYITSKGLLSVELTLPPDIYHITINTKLVNSLIRAGFQYKTPEITNWVDLDRFQGVFRQRNSKKYYNQAVRNGLSFDLAHSQIEELDIYNLVLQNRLSKGRPIYMSYKDIKDTGKLWPIDFFKVVAKDEEIVASAITYRNHPEICYALFWGDNDKGRPLRAMDYLAFRLWSYYKERGYKYLDLGISTEGGKPNEGLLRFKESHESTSSLRYTFSWEP